MTPSQPAGRFPWSGKRSSLQTSLQPNGYSMAFSDRLRLPQTHLSKEMHNGLLTTIAYIGFLSEVAFGKS